METPELISVVFPVNRALYIEDTLQSVLHQGYPNVEMIVVDDGSSNGTDEILKEHDDQG